MKRLFPYSVGFALTFGFAVLCSAGAYHFLSVLSRAIASESWPGVEGVVLSTRIREFSIARGGRYFYATVIVHYSFHGNEYTSEHYDARLQPRSFADRDNASAYIAEFAAGQAITVYVNPDDPSVGLMRRGLTLGVGIVHSAGVILFVGLTLLFAWGTKKTYHSWIHSRARQRQVC